MKTHDPRKDLVRMPTKQEVEHLAGHPISDAVYAGTIARMKGEIPMEAPNHKPKAKKPQAAAIADGAEQLLQLARDLSANSPRLGASMLLFAAAAMAPNRTTFLDAAAHVYDEFKESE